LSTFFTLILQNYRCNVYSFFFIISQTFFYSIPKMFLSLDHFFLFNYIILLFLIHSVIISSFSTFHHSLSWWFSIILCRNDDSIICTLSFFFLLDICSLIIFFHICVMLQIFLFIYHLFAFRKIYFISWVLQFVAYKFGYKTYFFCVLEWKYSCFLKVFFNTSFFSFYMWRWENFLEIL